MKIELSDETPEYCYFKVETQDDIFLLGQISRCLPNTKLGFSIDSKITLGVRIVDMLKKIVEPKEIISGY